MAPNLVFVLFLKKYDGQYHNLRRKDLHNTNGGKIMWKKYSQYKVEKMNSQYHGQIKQKTEKINSQYLDRKGKKNIEKTNSQYHGKKKND